MWSRNANSDFLFCRKYFCEFVLVIMLDHFIFYISTARLEFFRDDERNLTRFFEMTETWRNDSSSSTKAIHRTWRKRFIKLDKQHFVKFDKLYYIKLDERFIKSDRRYLIKLDKWYLIKLDEWYLIKLNEWYFIKFDEWYFIKCDKRYFIKFDWDFVCSLE
jgi:hypothetical protein